MQSRPEQTVPWHRVLATKLAERGMSMEDLAFEARRRGGPKISSSRISKIKSGERPLGRELLEAFAEILGEPPAIFAEYRLALARAQLDEREVGLDQALANLEAIEQALDVVGLSDQVLGELAAAELDASDDVPSQSDTSESAPATRAAAASRRRVA